MLLAIDIGNTNIVFGINDFEKWVRNWRIQTDALKTTDEYEVIFSSLLQMGEIDKSKISKVIFCTVVPTLESVFTEMLERLLQIKPVVLGPEIYPKLPVKVLNPNQIGADLVSNAAAAYSKFGDYTMVVDFGTALTFTTIGCDAEIVGVAIVPGLKTAMSSLAGNTAQLPYVHLAFPPSPLGDNTSHAIQAGIMFGYTGLADYMIEKTEQELNHKLNVVATGGLSFEISPQTQRIKNIDQLLTLDGLRIISGLI